MSTRKYKTIDANEAVTQVGKQHADRHRLDADFGEVASQGIKLPLIGESIGVVR